MLVLWPFKWAYNRLLMQRRRDYIKKLVANGLHIGDNVQIIDSFFFDPSHCFLISIGNNCTICPNVRLIAHDASTKMTLGYSRIGSIKILDNCFIGDSALILPGVVIGPNAVIGAGSVVTKSVPPDSVAAGNPARVINSFSRYIESVMAMSSGRTIFSEQYYIENLDEAKRKEIIESMGSGLGFIV